MKIIYSNGNILNATQWFIGLLTPSSQAGRFLILKPNNTVVSCQPDGTLQERPEGTDGGYEKCAQEEDVLIFNPLGGEDNEVFAIAYRLYNE